MSEKKITEKKILEVLAWAYEKSFSGLSKTESAIQLAESYIEKEKTPIESANALIRWQISKAASVGFITGLGGLVTLPIAIPLNIASIIYVQIRMITAIAHIAGEDVKNDKVKSLVFLCMVGSQATEILRNIGIQVGNQFAAKVIKQYITGEMIKLINQKVGFRLLTKFGSAGVINLGKSIPLVGGLIGGSFDAYTTNAIGNVARNLFIGKPEKKGKDEDISENDEYAKSELQRFYCLTNAIKIDKKIAKEELQQLYSYIETSGLPDDLKIDVLNKIRDEQLINIDFDLLKKHLPNLSGFIKELIDLAQIDYELHEKEKIYIEEVASELGVPKEHYEEHYTNRNFQYFIENDDLTINIDSNKLVKYINANIHIYIDDSTGQGIPISDIIEYAKNRNIILDFTTEWQGTDYITNIEVKNFKLFEHLKFELQPNINIILGHNGLGKTSILQSISLGLLSPASSAINKPNDFEKYIKKNTERTEIFVNYGKNEQRHLHVDKSGLIVFKSAQIEKNLLLSYGVNLNSDQENLKIIEKLIDGNGDNHYTASIFKDYSNDFSNPQTILFELIQQETDVANQIIDLLMDTLNEFLKLMPENETLILVKNGSRFKFKDFADNLLDIHNLSEGYKDHILLITDIVTRIIAARNTLFGKDVAITADLLANAKGTILIDEFDRHLHPSWQRKLLSQLTKTFAGVQFVLTTHNPFSLQSAEGFNALILETKKGEITITEKTIKSGLSIKSIYNMFFNGNNQFFSDKTEELFTKFYELIVKVKRQEATESELTKFKQITNQLLEMDEEVHVIISRELKQLERQTGKPFEL